MSKYLYLAVGLIIACANSVSWAGKTPINKSPSVGVTAPASGATFTAPANIILTATAADTDGTIARVEFYQGTTLIGTDSVAPYGVTWTNVAAGAYSLKAMAFDNLGAATTSSAVSVTVSGAKVIISSPANGAAIYGGEAALAGTFYGDSTTTVLVDNGNSTRLATVNGNAFSATLPVFIGTNTLKVLASRLDKTYDTASVTVTGNDYPKIAWKSPTTSIFDTQPSITFAVDAVSPSGSIGKVDFYKNDLLLATTTTPPYQTALLNLAAGNYTLSVNVTDNNGYSASVSRSIQVNGPNALPTANLTSPVNGAVYSAPANIGIAATATDSDGSITQVQFLQNGNILGVTNMAPYSLNWSNVAAGAYTLTASATDNRGGTIVSAPVNVTVTPPNTAPTVNLISPANNATFISPATISLAANAADSDGTIAKVEFLKGATVIGTTSVVPYAFSWTNAPVGSYAITAKATDNLGAMTVSAPISIIVVANSPPAVNLTSSTTGVTTYALAKVILTANAADSDGSIVKVEFYNGATLIGTVTSVPHIFNWTNVPAGSYSVTAIATDNLGATTTSAPVAVMIGASGLSFVAPANGAALNGDSVLVSGTLQASFNTGVTVNGVVAALTDDNHFYAKVPLIAGANTITATLSTPMGQSATQSITVNSDGMASPIKVTPDTLQGISPLTVNFQLKNNGTSVSNVQVNGGTPFSLPAGGKSVYGIQWDGAGGVAPVTITAIDAYGITSVQEFMIVVNDAAQVDHRFKVLWDGMNNAVITGDKATALSYLSGTAQIKYGPVFDALQADYQQIVSSWSAPVRGSNSNDIGEYAVITTNGNARQLFLIYFVKGTDGVWRLDSM